MGRQPREPAKPKQRKEMQALRRLARPAGLEPPTLGLEGRCSIHLSYGRARRTAPSVAASTRQGRRRRAAPLVPGACGNWRRGAAAWGAVLRSARLTPQNGRRRLGEAQGAIEGPRWSHTS